MNAISRRTRSKRIPFFFFFNDTAPPEIYPLPLRAALPISRPRAARVLPRRRPLAPVGRGALRRRRHCHDGGRLPAHALRAPRRTARRRVRPLVAVPAQIGRAHV